MKSTIIVILLCLTALRGYTQEKVNVRVINVQTNEPLELVLIVSNNRLLATSDSAGTALISLPAGTHRLLFTVTGYQPLDTAITLPGITSLDIKLYSKESDLEEVTIVASTRNNQDIESSPQKIEVLGATELSEEAGIKPGNIASILGDVSGVQIQQSSATSGNSNVRIQGLDGRYTQILRDGMPLYDGFSGGFGILTVPPLDLKQIELVKGAASTFYGGGAIGGIVNLISKRPTFKQTADALINYTTLKEFNANAYAAKRNNIFGYTLFAGYTGQQAVDVNKDGLSDVPDARSILVHPRLYCYPNTNTTLSLGYSGSFDNRTGGDMQVLRSNSDSIHRFYEKNTSRRHTGEYLAEYRFSNNTRITLKGNASNFQRQFSSDTYGIDGNQTSYYNEASVFTPSGESNNIVAGINITADHYETLKPDTALLKNYSNFITGAFGQYSLHVKERTIIEAGLRIDHHNTYGLFPLPRIAAFHRFTDNWACRAGFGMGYKVPNPLAQQTIEYDLRCLQPVNATVQPEIAYAYNAEVNYKKEWAHEKTLFINQAFFLMQVQRPILFQQSAGGVVSLANATSPVVSKGFDTYVKLELHSWELYLGYTYTYIRNTYLPSNLSFVPLTPKNRGAFVLVKEIKKAWRIGLEGSYVGNQYRYDGTQTPDYFFIAAMIQRNIGKHFAVVLNGENLLDYRMSNVEPLYHGTISNPTFKPLWAPIDGRVINLSLRWTL